MIEIPVEFVEFQARPLGKGKDMKEVKTFEHRWEDRPYMQLDLEKVVTPLMMKNNARVVDIELDKNYFSFTLQRIEDQVRIKYAFLKVENRNYQARTYFFEDQKIFGFFYSRKATLDSFEQHRKSDFEKRVFLSRFNPKNKEIIFHFTHNSPQWLRQTKKRLPDGTRLSKKREQILR